MKKLLIIICIGIVATLVVKYLTAKKEEAAKASLKAMLDAMKEKDVDRAMQYLDYDAVASELSMFAAIGGADFGPEEIKAQMRKNLEKEPFDYEILDTESKGYGTVRVTTKIKEEDGEVIDMYFIMKKKDGKWKCDLMATGKEKAKMEK